MKDKVWYTQKHRSIADGQFVLTHSEGSIAGNRHAYFELWRVDNGKLLNFGMQYLLCLKMNRLSMVMACFNNYLSASLS